MAQEPDSQKKTGPEQEKSTTEKDGSVGWLDRFTQRSTGLPDLGGDSSPPSQPEPSPWRFAGLGLQLAATSAIFALGGMYLDRRMGWTPWGTVILTGTGFIGGMYLLIREGLKENAANKGGRK